MILLYTMPSVTDYITTSFLVGFLSLFSIVILLIPILIVIEFAKAFYEHYTKNRNFPG